MIDKNFTSPYNNSPRNGPNLDNDIPQGSCKDKGGAIMDKNITLHDYITLWLDLFKKKEVKTGTFHRMETSNILLGKYDIGAEKVVELSPLDVQLYINQIANDGYSLSTIKKQLDLIRASLRKAVSLKIISDNPALEISIPSKSMLKKKTKKIVPYDETDQTKLQKYIQNHTDDSAVMCVAFMIETGLRVGEALALKWSDVQIEKHKVHVHATVVNTHDSKHSFVQDSPKTNTSNRTIPLNQRATVILNTVRRNSDNEFIFGKKKNKHLDYFVLRNTIMAMCKEAGVEYRGTHVFRHTFATNCFYKGIDVKILSRLLGHCNVSVTYNIYIDLYGDGFDDMYAALCL